MLPLGLTGSTQLDTIPPGPGDGSTWTPITIFSLFSGQWSRSDHFPVVATLETATARKSTAHELKIDTSLYADPKVRKIINQLWEAIYKDYNPPSIHGHAWYTYTKAKDETSELMRQLTRE
eukprot:scaffold20365_cov132-Isochrysis_galbana.AAC.1